MGKDITLSEDQLNRLIQDASKSAVAAYVAAHEPPKPEDMTADGQFHRWVDNMKGHDRPATPMRKVACKSPTGATFVAVVADSRTHPGGRVINLEQYRHPEGVDRYQADGGLVPDGFPMAGGDGKASSSLYKQWRWESFYQADLRSFVGKPLPPHVIVEEPKAPELSARAAE